jgi:hypothetical protein
VRRRIAIAVAWFTCLAGAIGLVVAATTSGGLADDSAGFPFIFVGLALTVATDASVGAVLMLRRPGNFVGLILVLAALVVAATFLAFILAAALVEARGQRDVLAGLASVLAGLGIYPSLIVAGPLLALVFPDGRLPGSRWKWPAGLIVALLVVGSAMVAVRPGPTGGSLADNPLVIGGLPGSDAFWAMGEVITAAALPLSLLLALAAVTVRVRRAGEVERAQLKWFVAAYLAAGTVIAVSFADGTTQTPIDLIAPWSFSLPPIAVGIAILRYRLFEIDRIVSRTIGWATLTGLLVAVYLAAVLFLQSQLSGITQGQTLAVAASTLLAAAVFQPARRRIQRMVDRCFDRARYDGEHTVAAYTEDLRDQVDLGAISVHTVAAVDAAVRPRGTSLWLREPGR